MFLFSAAKIILLSLGLLSSGANGHGVEVRSCINTSGDLRIFVEHWHGDLSATTSAGTMEITNDITGVQSTLFPTGFVNNIDLDNGGVLPDCASTILDSTCTSQPAYNDWVYYDFPFACDTAVSYSLIQGNTVVLMEACDNLYPATINPFDSCANAPSQAPSSTCVDTGGRFTVGTGEEKGCNWLKEKEIRQVRHCGTAEVQQVCPDTCCDCGECPTSRPTPTPAPVSAAPTASKGKGSKGKGNSKGKDGKSRRVLRGH